MAESSAGRSEERVQVVILPEENDINSRYPPLNSGPNNVYSSIAPDEEIMFSVGTIATLRCNVGKSPTKLDTCIDDNDNISVFGS